LFEAVLHGLACFVHDSQPEEIIFLTVGYRRGDVRRVAEESKDRGYIISEIIHGTYGFFLGDFSFFEMLGKKANGLLGEEDNVLDRLARDDFSPFADARLMRLDGAGRERGVLKVSHRCEVLVRYVLHYPSILRCDLKIDDAFHSVDNNNPMKWISHLFVK
jgi:hypothetical protein